MFAAMVERGGIFYRLGVFTNQAEADAAKEVAELCLDKFLGTPGSLAALRVPPAHLRHPSVDLLLREPSLERALAKLSSGDTVKQVAACAPPVPAAPAPAPAVAAPSCDATPQNDTAVAKEATPEISGSVLTAAKAVSLAAAALSPDRKAPPPKWLEWPPGSGNYAHVLSKQNFPARIAVHRSGVWIMAKIFGDELITEISAQDNALASKCASVTLAFDDGAYPDTVCSLRLYHNSSGTPFYLTSITWIFKKYALAMGDIVQFLSNGPRRATFRVIRCSTEEAKKVHAATGFDLEKELAKVESGAGAKRAAEEAAQAAQAKRPAKADLRGRLINNPFGGIAKLPVIVPDAECKPHSSAAAPAPAPRPLPAPGATSNPFPASTQPTIAAIPSRQLPVEGATAPAALLAVATMALADASFRVPGNQMTAMHTWYRGMAIARKMRVFGYEVGALTPAAYSAIDAEVSAELKAMAPRERVELVMKCYLGSYNSIIAVKKSTKMQAVIDETVASWRWSAWQPKSVEVVEAVDAPEPQPKPVQEPRMPAPAKLGPPLAGAGPAPPMLVVSRLVVQQQQQQPQVIVSGGTVLRSPEPPRQGTQAWSASPPPVIRSRPAVVQQVPRPGAPQSTAPLNAQPLDYVPPPWQAAFKGAAPAARPGAPAPHLLPSAPHGAHLLLAAAQATKELPSGLEAAQELRSALEAAGGIWPPPPVAAARAPPTATRPPAQAVPVVRSTTQPTVNIVPAPGTVRPLGSPPAAPAAAARPRESSNPTSPRTEPDFTDSRWVLAHLRTVAVLDRLASASEALRDAVKSSFVKDGIAPEHASVLTAVEGVAERLEGAAKAVSLVVKGQGPNAVQGGKKRT